MASSRVRVDGIVLTNVLATMGVVVPSNIQQTFIEIVLHNQSGSAQAVDVHFIKSGDTAGNKNKVIGHQSGNEIPAGETRVYPFQPMLNVGDFIQAKVGNTQTVSFSAGILQESL